MYSMKRVGDKGWGYKEVVGNGRQLHKHKAEGEV